MFNYKQPRNLKLHFIYWLLIVNIIVWANFYFNFEDLYKYVIKISYSVAGEQITPTQNEIPETVEDKIYKIAIANNFQWPDYLLRLANCESRFNPKALGDNSKSRGLFQIHSGYHPEVSDECAFDIQCATKWTMWRINSGYQTEWTCDRYIK